jgi:tetratricopeptide (TPR) repeat protein
MARFFVGIAHHCGGDYGAAVEKFREVVELLADRPDERFGEPGLPAQCALAFQSWSLAELGRFDEAIAVGAEALRIAEAVDQPFTLMHGYFLGITYLERGDLERAIPLLERGFALCRATDLHLWAAETAADLGYAYALAGRLDDIAPVVEAALAEATATNLQFTYARQHALAGEASGSAATSPRRSASPFGRSTWPARTSSAGKKRELSTSPRWSLTTHRRRPGSEKR